MLRPKRTMMAVAILCAATLGMVGLAEAQVGPTAQGNTAGGGMYPYLGTARAVGMGNAFTAIADDNGALIWNPAGLVQVGGGRAQIDAEVNQDDMGYFTASYLFRKKEEQLKEAVLFTRASLDNLVGGDNRDDTILQYSIAQQFDRQTSFGASLKFHSVDLGDLSDEAFSFDLGVLYEVDLKQPPTEEGFTPSLKLGLAVLDVNEPTFDRIGLQKRTVNLGAAYRLDPGTIVGLEVYDIGDHANRSEIRLGGERLITDRITLRAGVADSDFSIGLGINYRSFNVEFGFRRVEDGPDLNMLSINGEF